MTLKLLILWVTNDCNLRCKYCYARGGENPEYMSWEIARRALNLVVKSSSGFKVQFAGGEPLLNLDLIQKVVEYTKGWDVRYQLQTNATLIDAAIAESLGNMEIDVGVSLDGLPAVNDSLRPFANGTGSTAATIAGIERLRAVGTRVGLTSVVCSESIHGLPDLVALASYLGNVEGISLDMLRSTGRAFEAKVGQANLELATHCVREALYRADEIAAIGGNRVRFREVERLCYLVESGGVRAHRCYFDADQSLMVKPDGSAYPCASLADSPDLCLGNIMESTFEGKIMQSMGMAREACGISEHCPSCPDWHLCGGPCPAQVYAQRRIGQSTHTECAVRTAFMDHVRSKGNSTHASETTCLPV